jgi:hypothetical protein
MSSLVQAQPTQCLSFPGSIRSPVDRRGLKRLAALIPEDQGVDRRLTRRDPMLPSSNCAATSGRRFQPPSGWERGVPDRELG